MQNILKLQKKIVPELLEVLEKRYNILRTIYYNQPIGRRVLANNLTLGERIVRTEINFLKSQNLIEINTPGMTVTKDGEEILEHLNQFIHEIKGLSDLEKEVKMKLGIGKVIIVPGDVYKDETVLKELGKAASLYLKKIIKNNDVIALTGGGTVREVIEHFPKMHHSEDVLVVPARGGMGKKVENQANTLAGKLAGKLNGQYKMLHVPENLNEEILETLLQQKEIKEVVDNIHKANVIIYGIGRAERMAKKRGFSENAISNLEKLGAIGEALGSYFNKKSQVVLLNNNIGINRSQMNKEAIHIAVAGGSNKAEAILSVDLSHPNIVLVTDEGAAEGIINMLSNK